MKQAEIQKKQLNELVLWHKNPRAIKEVDYERLKNLIKELGLFKPFVINQDNIILGGNMRYRVCKDLGYKEVFVSVVKTNNEAEMFSYALADNDRAGYYEEDKVAELVLQNPTLKLDLHKLDLGQQTSIEEILERFGPSLEEDEPPELEEGEAISKLGEVYQLGRHRVMCGDATKIADVEKLMDGEKAKTLFTSPPYNMAREMYENYTDDLKSKEYIEFNIKTVKIWKKYLFGYIFWNVSYNKNSRWEFLEIMYRLLKETGFRFLELIVWDKGHGMPITSKDMLTREYEDILLIGDERQIQRDIDFLYVGTKYSRANFYKTKFTGTTNYWRVIPNKIQIKNHKAIYPVEIPAKGIMMTTKMDDIVTDPFGGSGSTLIACEQTNRTCYMMELDEHYVDVIRKRYHKFVTGSEEGWEINTPKLNV